MNWDNIEGWFLWRSAQEEAVDFFPAGSRLVEVGTYLGRSLCSLAEVATQRGKEFKIIGVDTCRGSGQEGLRNDDYHGEAVGRGGGTFAGELHRNVINCGVDNLITLMISDSVSAAQLFADSSLEWVHLDARHDYEGVKADILAWLPKVKAGGWLSGDDYDAIKWPDVVAAVTNLLPDAQPWSTQQWRFTVNQTTSVASVRPPRDELSRQRD